MKRIFFTIAMLFSIALLGAQSIAHSAVGETEYGKKKLFSLTKMFVADKWNNPQDATVNADEEAGIVQVNAAKEIGMKVGMGLTCLYTYNYKVKFLLKENKYKIDIHDVECVHAEQIGLGGSASVPPIQYFEGRDTDQKTKTMGRGISKKQAAALMDELRSEFIGLTENYDEYLKSNSNDF